MNTDVNTYIHEVCQHCFITTQQDTTLQNLRQKRMIRWDCKPGKKQESVLKNRNCIKK